VIIDSDLQDPPDLIPEMFALWRQGYQVVYGMRETRAGETAFIDYAESPALAGLDPALKDDPVQAHHWACAPYAFLSLCSDGAALPGKAYNHQQ
jgi:hypothetical protein